LETFARFGARLDEATRKTIEHGRRIRASLKQAELAPLAIPDQIAILLALNAGLFDTVPLQRMGDAQAAICTAVAGLPSSLKGRLSGIDKLVDADRASVIEMLHRPLAPFASAPAAPLSHERHSRRTAA
jgi:F-type H+/Na+-transporting ATPase subunit alpha